jgi:histidinol-phosphate/aromatic aminotransferase/cobyric acid decarboxylase-like protein
MEVSPFRIERYYARYEFTTRYMLSSSERESRTIAELLELEPHAHERLINTWCSYTESPGSLGLRKAIAALYERIDPDEVIVTTCAEEGILLIYQALLGTGDHAVVEMPCYESAFELVRRTGAAVSGWRRRYDDGWAHDLDSLAALIRPETRVIYVNQPHNTAGTLMDRATFEQAVDRFREQLAGQGVLLVPGSVDDEPSHVRVGFGRANLPAAWEALEAGLAAPAAV